VHENMPIQIQIFERRQSDAGERLRREALGIVPLFDQSDRIITTDPAGIGPCRSSQSLYRDGRLVAGIHNDLGSDMTTTNGRSATVGGISLIVAP